MNEINEKETIQYFVQGISRARSAAKELARLNKRALWLQISKMLEQLSHKANLLHTGKAQTRTDTLILANKIQATTEKPPATTIVH